MIAALLVALVGTAAAQEAHTPAPARDRRGPGTHFDLLVGTRVPLDVGGRVQLEVPGRLRLVGHAGWLPPAYVSLVNEVGTAAGLYDEAVGSLVAASLRDAVVAGAGLGWRPFRRAGLVLGVGWQVATLGGGVGTADVVEAVGRGRVDLPADLFVPVASTLHMITADLAVEHVSKGGFVLRVALGGAFTVGARTRLSLDGLPLPREATAVVAPIVEAALDDALESWVHVPTLGLSIGYRFI